MTYDVHFVRYDLTDDRRTDDCPEELQPPTDPHDIRMVQFLEADARRSRRDAMTALEHLSRITGDDEIMDDTGLDMAALREFYED